MYQEITQQQREDFLKSQKFVRLFSYPDGSGYSWMCGFKVEVTQETHSDSKNQAIDAAIRESGFLNLK